MFITRTHSHTVVPPTTDSGVSPDAYDALRLRLWVTAICSTVSMLSSIVMFRAYRRYRALLSNAYNDLYVYGLGGFQCLQSAQFLLFAAVHLVEMISFSGPSCIANAVLDQFLNFGGQVFALGFMVSMVTLRGQCDCCLASTVSAVRTKSYGTSAPQLLSEHRRAMADGTTHVQHQQTDDRGEQYTAIATSASGAALRLSRVVWPVFALVGAIGTTVWMCAVVVQDPHQAPLLNHHSKAAPLNFELSLGWCWIPEFYPMLRFLCCYLLSGITVVCGCLSLLYLLRFEFQYSFRDHLPIYIRIGALIAWTLVAYLVGAISRFAGDPADGATIATAIFTLDGLFVSCLFLWTERAVGPFFFNRGLPGNGFSSCVNHLLLIEIAGVPLPQNSAQVSRQRFESDAFQDDGSPVPSTQQLLMLGREDSYHVARCNPEGAADDNAGHAYKVLPHY